MMRGSLRHCPRCLSRLSVLGRHPRRRRSPAAPGVFQDASKPSDSRSYHCPVRSAMFTRFRRGRAVARRTARARTAASCPRRRAPCSPPFARHRPREEPAPRGAGHRPEHQPACPSRLPDGPRRRPVIRLAVRAFYTYSSLRHAINNDTRDVTTACTRKRCLFKRSRIYIQGRYRVPYDVA